MSVLHRCMRGRWPVIATMLAVLMLAGCSKPMQELYGELSEANANEMVLALRNHQIHVAKVATKTGFSVMASDADFAQAVRVLSAEGLPRTARPSVLDLFPSGKMFTTPTEQAIRARFALEQQIAADLQMIQGVREAQVILALPEAEAHGPLPSSSASVMIIFDDRLESEGFVPRVKLFVENSVPQLPGDHISVVMFHSNSGQPAALPEQRMAAQ